MKVFLVVEYFYLDEACGCEHKAICSSREIAEAVKKDLGVHNLRVEIQEFELL